MGRRLPLNPKAPDFRLQRLRRIQKVQARRDRAEQRAEWITTPLADGAGDIIDDLSN